MDSRTPQRAVYKMTGCKKCNRLAHDSCITELFIPKKAFVCRKISRHLGEQSKEIYGLKEVGGYDIDIGSDDDESEVHKLLKPPEPRRREMCLICGDVKLARGIVIKCTEDCEFFCHNSCLKLHNMVTNSCISENMFMCSDVLYQMRPVEVAKALSGGEVGLRKIREVLKRRGSVLSPKYNRKRKRWMNDEIQCMKCNMWYDTNEQDHVALYCRAAAGYPITDRNRSYPFAHLKRFRHLTRLVP